MKSREWQAILRSNVIARLPGYSLHGRLIYANVLDRFIRGYYFEDSEFERARFTAYAFVQPLFVPMDSFVFTLGWRLGDRSMGLERWWSLGDKAAFTQVCALIDIEGESEIGGITSLEALAAWLELSGCGQESLYGLESLAYCYVYLGETGKFQRAANDLRQRLKEEDQVGWVAATITRLDRVAKERALGKDSATNLLDEWSQHTRKALRL